MKKISMRFLCVSLVLSMFSLFCSASDLSLNTYRYSSASESARYGITDENTLRAIYSSNEIVRTTQQTESGNNTSFSTADNITVNPVFGNDSHMFGSLSSTNTVDYYKITPPRHGRIYVTLVSPTGYNYTVNVYDSSHNALQCDYSTNNAKSFMATKGTLNSSTLPTYYISVSSSSGYSSGSYRVIVFYALNYLNLNFNYPTDDSLIEISSPVGYRTVPQNEYHLGIDILAEDQNKSYNIYSICNATVLRAGYDTSMGVFVQAITDFPDSSIFVDVLDEYTNTPYMIRYMHMEDGSLDENVYAHNTITKGQRLGTMGTTGYSTGIHLHIDINNGLHLLQQDINADLKSVINPIDLYDKSFTGNVY